MEVLLLFNSGDHVPEMLLSEVVGKGGIVSPSHTGAICVKIGIIFGSTPIVIVVGVAHEPAEGVKV